MLKTNQVKVFNLWFQTDSNGRKIFENISTFAEIINES